MKHWFEALPLHRKLVTLVLGVSTAAILAAVVGLVAFDVERFRGSVADDARTAAQMIAENTAAAIVFDDAEAARQTLGSVRVRPLIVAACVYRQNGSLLADYTRDGGHGCPARPADRSGWRYVSSAVPVTRNGAVVGVVYVERALADLVPRVAATAGAGAVMLLVAGVVALLLAQWLQHLISGPIVALARAIRSVRADQPYTMPPIAAAPDETGELVDAFEAMVHRISEARQALMSSNEALRAEVERRRQMQADREQLLAREQEASRLKDEFLAAVSHELRTPLNAILGWTQILASTSPTEQTMAKALASLSRNAQAQNRVIQDLLDTSRIITGKLQLTLTAVDLRSVVESSLEVVEPIAAAKNIHLDAQVPSVACIVQADYDRLRQILWNLLSNAMKFTPSGGAVTLRLTQDARVYLIAVSDTGIGIPPAFLSHVFERFRQADGTTTREHGGLGLGLAIVKELTELHAGTVQASSEGPGRGATFLVALPQFVAPQPAVPAAQGAPPVPRLDGLTILVVDDNPDAVDIATSVLTDAGAIVRTASSGVEALALWQRSPADVLVCDLAMPRMDGFDVLRRIRGLDASRGRMTPALAVTAYASDENRARCAGAGFQGHIAKPFNTVELVRAVAAATDVA